MVCPCNFYFHEYIYFKKRSQGLAHIKEQYTFLVITSQTVKIACDFYKKLNSDSNLLSETMFVLKFSSSYNKKKGNYMHCFYAKTYITYVI